MWRSRRAWLSAPLLAALVVAALLGGSRAARADPVQHVWLHYDYMVAADGRSDAPDPAAIQLVVDAFAAHGIQLHVDPQHAAIPMHRLIIPDFNPAVPKNACPGFDEVNFTDLKAQYFHPTANHEWHYVIFGDYQGGTASGLGDPCSEDFSTGYSEIPGDNFIITLRHLHDIGLPLNPYIVGGTFMHELGHNLGLRHGGNVDDNFKSNYLSVMNYAWQFGILYSASPGSTSIVGRKLDYSEEALPTLDESHLNETLGIGATLPTDTTDITFFDSEFGFGFGAASGPIDWNLNGVATDTDVAADIDLTWDVTVCGGFCLIYDLETGFNDWAEVHAYLAGTFNPGPKTFEHENRANEPIVATVSPNVGPVTGGTQVTVTGEHFDKTTAVSFGGRAAASFTVINDRTLSTVAPPGTGIVDVVVSNGDNPSPSVQSDQFTYIPPPTIASLAPTTGPPAGGTAITIKGTHLTGTTRVLFGAIPAASFTVVDDSTINAVTPAGLGTVDVTATTPYGTSPTGVPDRFTFVVPPPTVTSVAPPSGLPGALVTISGTAFTGATQVCFGGTCVGAALLTVVNDSTITAPVPLSPLEGSTVDVTVTTPAGTSPTTANDRFTLL